MHQLWRNAHKNAGANKSPSGKAWIESYFLSSFTATGCGAYIVIFGGSIRLTDISPSHQHYAYVPTLPETDYIIQCFFAYSNSFFKKKQVFFKRHKKAPYFYDAFVLLGKLIFNVSSGLKSDRYSPRYLTIASVICQNSTGGIALPIWLYAVVSVPANIKSSGNDWIRAASNGVNLR